METYIQDREGYNSFIDEVVGLIRITLVPNLAREQVR